MNMDHEKQLKLQAFLDEELSEAEAKEVASWLAKDQEATLLLAELRNTRQSMARFEAGVRLPESREFYWSKIEREIERLEPARPQARRERPPRDRDDAGDEAAREPGGRRARDDERRCEREGEIDERPLGLEHRLRRAGRPRCSGCRPEARRRRRRPRRGCRTAAPCRRASSCLCWSR